MSAAIPGDTGRAARVRDYLPDALKAIIRQTYYGYTRREAIAEFLAYVKAEESKLIREGRK